MSEQALRELIAKWLKKVGHHRDMDRVPKVEDYGGDTVKALQNMWLDCPCLPDCVACNLKTAIAALTNLLTDKSKLRAAVEAAIDRGVATWQEDHCQEIECGCVADYVKKEIQTVLANKGGKGDLIPDTEEGLSSEQLAQRWPGGVGRRSQDGQPVPSGYLKGMGIGTGANALCLNGKATNLIWLMEDGEEPHVIGIRVDCGDSGTLYVTRSQALDLSNQLRQFSQQDSQVEEFDAQAEAAKLRVDLEPSILGVVPHGGLKIIKLFTERLWCAYAAGRRAAQENRKSK